MSYLILLQLMIYYRDRIKCPKQRTKTGLATVEITISFPPWFRLYLSDILFCYGNSYRLYNVDDTVISIIIIVKN